MAQLLHASSTRFLVILSAPRVTPAQEAPWYAVYAALLWAVVIVAVTVQNRLWRTAAPPRPAADYALAAR
jgi:hypothetical protein